MRFIAFIATIAALAVTGSGSATTAPKLRLADGTTVAVRGSSFASSEAVRVVVTKADGKLVSKRVFATLAGRFYVRFASLPADWCVIRRVTAVGSKGSRAVLRFPITACPNPPA